MSLHHRIDQVLTFLPLHRNTVLCIYFGSNSGSNKIEYLLKPYVKVFFKYLMLSLVTGSCTDCGQKSPTGTCSARNS